MRFAARLAAALFATAAALAPSAALAHPPLDHRDPSVTDEEEGRGVRRGAPTLFARELEDPATLGLGRIARDVARSLPEVQSLADFLAPRVRGLGFARVLPVIARDDSELADLVRRGIVDLVSGSALTAIHLSRVADAKILLLERRDGRDTTTSVLFTAADSPVHELADLRGRRVALDGPGATTAFGLPLLALREAGLRTVALHAVTDVVPPDAVGWFFSRSDSSVVASVLHRGADAGAIDGVEWRRRLAEDDSLATSLRVIRETPPVPRAFLLAGPSVSPAAREGLRRELLAMSDDAAGRDVLARYHRVDRFAPLDSALEARLAELGPAWESLRGEMAP